MSFSGILRGSRSFETIFPDNIGRTQGKKEMGFVRDCSSTMLFGGKYKYFFCCLEDEKLNIF
jgi:hypothetical protein